MLLRYEAINYSYDGSGLLTGIETAAGTDVDIDVGSSGEVESIEVDPSDGGPAVTAFEYGDGKTIVTDADENEHSYLWDEDDGFADPPALQDEMVETLEESRDLTQEEAEEHLEIQNRADGLSDALEGELGNDFVSMFQDRESGEIIVNVTDDEVSESVGDVLDAFGLTADARIEEVAFSESDLEEVFDDVSAELLEEEADELAMATISDGTNRVHIETGESISSEDQGVVDDLVSNSGGAVEAVEVDDEEFDIEDFRDCSWGYLPDTYTGCRRPLRGGIGIGSNIPGNDASCSSAFVARTNSSNNRLGLMTAGHCVGFDTVPDTSVLWGGSTLRKSGSGYASKLSAMGRITSNGEYGSKTGGAGDTGIIIVSKSTGWYAGGAKPWVAMNNGTNGRIALNSKYVIKNKRRAYEGKILCDSGALRGQDCGEVQSTGAAPKWNGSRRKPMIEVSSLCDIGPGDSGSPLVGSHFAYGILSGGTTCTQYFTPTYIAEDETDSQIVKKDGPSIKFNSARLRPGLTSALDHDEYMNERVSYSVNPRGSETRIRVEVKNAFHYWSSGSVESSPPSNPPTSFSWTSGTTMPCVDEDEAEIRLVATNDSGVTYGPWIEVDENCEPT